MTIERGISELIEKLEQIHKLSDLGSIDSITKESGPVDIPEILKIKAQIRNLTERVEVLENEKKAQKKD